VDRVNSLTDLADAFAGLGDLAVSTLRTGKSLRLAVLERAEAVFSRMPRPTGSAY
jgi:hypothetical protein